jgi:U4/U6 small nuclear ribonucleoprotein PRP31
MKEKYQVTELQKQKNRVAFGKAETTDDYTGEGYGMIGQEGSGQLAIRPKDNLKLSKRM